MCFSFEVSVATFVISWSISFYLLRKNLTKYQRQNIIFLMIFSSIQLADAILWYHKMKKNNINYLVTSYLIPFLLSLQLLYNNFIRLESYGKMDNIIRLISIYCIYYIFIRFNGYSNASCDSYFSSPIWAGKEVDLYILLGFGILVTYPHYDRELIALLTLIILQLITNSGYGSMWCAITNLIAFYYLYKY